MPFGLEDGKSSDGRPFDADDLSVLKHMEHLEELIVRDYRSLCISDDALVSIIGGFLYLVIERDVSSTFDVRKVRDTSSFEFTVGLDF